MVSKQNEYADEYANNLTLRKLNARTCLCIHLFSSEICWSCWHFFSTLSWTLAIWSAKIGQSWEMWWGLIDGSAIWTPAAEEALAGHKVELMFKSKKEDTEVCKPLNKKADGKGHKAGSMFKSEKEDPKVSELINKGVEEEGDKVGSMWEREEEDIKDCASTGHKAGSMSGVEGEGIGNALKPATVWPLAVQPPTMQQCLWHICHWHLHPILITTHFK